ncbi:lamina-associated polypeptide 2, isoforms beta/gamma-like isoform X1 [Notothenia coriiceps]|uniref:Lamina-associated polypeptide 2, isoforms beta/gamma-like isoform X1 n=1 Tax=Notothenia coriiceps TaxID=8208 RepID=A0A6I9N940_9TELE|nr:PREDICTED: lamina-associated polypeptide 2, isoforms beta/gamma-like isoform X1 [Notothenia coriiceps]
MSEYLDDPSVLTKEKLKTELAAHDVELPNGNPTKDVYVQLYLKHITANNKKHVTTSVDVFSSDEDLPPPVVSSRSRSSGRKATRKTDKVLPDEMDVTVLTDGGLMDELQKHGVNVGPIVASTRKLYERKLQKLLDEGPAQPPLPEVIVTETQVNHNGNSDSDLYSDKEDEVIAEPEPVPEPEPEPVPVVERPVRSRGKTPITTRTRSSQHHTRDQLMDEEDDDDDNVLQVKRRSRRSSQRMTVPEDLRPLSMDQIQVKSNRRVSQRLDSPVRAEPPPISSRPVQLKDKELVLLPKPCKDSPHKSVILLNTAWLEEPEPIIAPLKPGVRSQRPTARPSRPSSPLVQLVKVDPVTFSPMCKMSPIKRQEYRESPSDRSGSKPNGVSVARDECASPDVLLHGRRQQKITSFMSKYSPMKTLNSTSILSNDVLVKKVEKIAAGDQPQKVVETEVLKELFPNDVNSPTGITATCRRPIRGAAHRPLKPSDLWNGDENSIFSPKTTKTTSSFSSYTQSCTDSRVTSLPISTTSTSSFSSSSSSRLLSAAPPAGYTKAAPRSMALWKKLFLLAVLAGFLFLVYQAMETNIINPFDTSGTEVASSGTA